ncbi:hypothetical protein PSTG_14793 [Puccinia striiformis f. sp. tritici PST-78]|uniref:Phosphatidic acid phosphatase type 2/haloperoxidase domain-containing protein n=1 Tax=Puccinia striiformis f. sp. tritici PST-78 TaxID=1165861 RepID=A0A0L0UXM0_9BASI|nr:hypothetical protein PSTG_14793 [Puccinia striiformis f. sp. tritici PST-78]
MTDSINSPIHSLIETCQSDSLDSSEPGPADGFPSLVVNKDSGHHGHPEGKDASPDGQLQSHSDNEHKLSPPPITRSSSGSSTKSHNQPVNLNIPVISTAGPVGLQADHVYRSQLSPWRFKIRSFLLKSLNKEMPILESIQDSYRSGPLDRIMIHSSWLGSHQFFIVALPLIFWLGDHQFGRSQVYILGMSVYFTGVLKDLFCIPRPYSPPIQRLSISNHASEYGFPSSHSATSASTFLMGFQYALNLQSIFHQFGLYLGLILYGFLLVFGRVYCGMHSIQDVICGWMIGVFAWSIHQFFGEILERWATSPQTSVPLILIISGLILTAAYPQPVDDCPCFEDSTAFVAVSVGVMIGHRIANDLILRQIDDPSLSGLRFPQALIKLILGLLVIFGWRFSMKEILSRLLPPLFRLFAPLVELPRKHYAPTKDYGRYRDELRERGRRTGLSARLIPSVVDLPDMSGSLRNRFASDSTPTDIPSTQALHPALHNRTPNAIEYDPLVQTQKAPSSDFKQSTTLPSKRYDVDVLMRLIVYVGIGMLSSGLLPMFFERIGLNS